MPEPIIIPVIYTEDTSGLERASQATSELQKATKEMRSAQQRAFADGANEASRMADALNETGAEMADLEATTKRTTAAGGAFKSYVGEQVRGLSLFGRNIGDVVDGLRQKQVALKGVISALGGASGALRVLKVALVSTGIGAIVVLLGSLIAFLTKTQAGTNKLAQVMAGFGAVVDLATNKLIQIGKETVAAWEAFKEGYPTLYKILGVFGDIAKGAFELASGIKYLTMLFPEATEEFKQAAIEAAKLEAASQRLADSERELAVQTSERRAEIERLKEISDDETKSYNERIIASKAAGKAEQETIEKQIELAEESLRIITAQNKMKGELLKDDDAQAEATIRLNELKADAAKKERLDENRIQALLRQHQREVQKLAEEERKREEQRLKIEAANRQAFTELQRNLAKQLDDEEELTKTKDEQLRTQKANALEALNIAKLELIARAKYLGQEEEIAKIQTDFTRLRALTAERYEKEITKFIDEETAKRNKELEDATDEYLQKQQGIRDKRLQFIRNEQELDEMRIDAIKKSGNDELSLEQFKEDAKLRLLKNSLERQRRVLLETDTTGQGVELFDVKKIDAEISVIEDKLAELNEKPIFERIRERFKNLFNLSEEDVQAIGDQISSITQNIFDGLSSLNDAELSQQQRIIDARQENIDALKAQLDEELELKRQGYANNSTALQEQLDEQTNLLAKEEEKRLALEKKAASLRLKQNALEIASNIALAAAKAIESNAKFGLVGIVTAAAQVASIFALIAKAKAQAAQFSAPEKLRKGAKLEGRSHEMGGVPLLVSDESGGRMYEAEKDEWLIGTKPSREHDSFLNRLNENEFEGMELNRHVDFSSDFFNDPIGMLNELAPKYQVPIATDYLGMVMPDIRRTIQKMSNYQATSTAQLHNGFTEMNRRLTSIEAAIKEQPQLVPITEFGYLEKRTVGNQTQLKICEPPKRKNT